MKLNYGEEKDALRRIISSAQTLDADYRYCNGIDY